MAIQPLTSPTLPDPSNVSAKADPKAIRAAREFEAIFVRTMLKSLEKATGTGQTHGVGAAGQSNYGSLVVGAVADAVTAAGGLGLADLIARHLATQGGDKVPR